MLASRLSRNSLVINNDDSTSIQDVLFCLNKKYTGKYNVHSNNIIIYTHPVIFLVNKI